MDALTEQSVASKSRHRTEYRLQEENNTFFIFNFLAQVSYMGSAASYVVEAEAVSSY